MVKWTPSGRETAAERQVRRDGEREFEKRIGFGPGGGGDVRGELGEPRGVVRREFESVEERRLDADFAPRAL